MLQIIFILLMALFTYGATANNLPPSSSSSGAGVQTDQTNPVPKFDYKNPQAKGIILVFHRWPSDQEKEQLIKKLQEMGLEKTKEIELFKSWVFEWPDWKKGKEAEEVCDSFSDLPNLDYCEPEYLLGPAMNKRKKQKKKKNTSAPVASDESSSFNSVKSVPLKPPLPLDQSGDVRSCKTFSSDFGLFGGELSDYWAQEMIGSDLLKKELSKAHPVEKHLVSVWDVGKRQREHGVVVENLVSDEGKHAVLPELGNKISNHDVLVPSAFSERAAFYQKKVISKCGTSSFVAANRNYYRECAASVSPSFINNSMYWGDYFGKKGGETIYRAFRKMSPPSIVVTIAGNLYPDPRSIPPYKVKASKDFDAIIVGSMAPNGYKSRFSQEGEAVHIMAPSDYYITSADKDGNYRKFGGTSGAAPLVTGSLAGFEWLSGYHPTAEEAKILLAKTAIPTLYSNDDPRKNGAGMVNAYKLGMVGKRLKQICSGRRIGWRSRRSRRSIRRCFKKLIQMDSTYTFSEDSDLSQKLDQIFPECSRAVCNSNDDDQPAMCADTAAVVERLRKTAFLNPQNKELWRSLACVYASGDFTKNSKGVLSFYRSLSEEYAKDDKFCRLDEDCTFVPACGYKPKIDFGVIRICRRQQLPICKERKEERELLKNNGVLIRNKSMAEVHYIEYCLKENDISCKENGENTENLTEFASTLPSYNIHTKCVDSKCVKIDIDIIPKQKKEKSSKKKNNGSVQ